MWMAAAVSLRLRRGDRVLATTWNVATHLTWCRTVGASLGVVFHGSDLTRAPRDPQGLSRVCRTADHRYVVSRYLGHRLREQGFESVVLPSPVDLRPPSTPRLRPERWLYVGRATPLKGGDRFIRLVAAAGVEGVVYGDGPALAGWKTLAQELGANVRFAGRVPRDEVRRAIPEFDLALLLPRDDTDGSGAEGFGLTLVEAAAAGVATIGCRTGGVVESAGAGLVLEDPDDVTGSVAAIGSWWTPFRGQACRRFVADNHGIDRVVRRLMEGT
jgi:glycosyltransferase involved in cell wall biosynthesis